MCDGVGFDGLIQCTVAQDGHRCGGAHPAIASALVLQHQQPNERLFCTEPTAWRPARYDCDVHDYAAPEATNEIRRVELRRALHAERYKRFMCERAKARPEDNGQERAPGVCGEQQCACAAGARDDGPSLSPRQTALACKVLITTSGDPCAASRILGSDEFSCARLRSFATTQVSEGSPRSEAPLEPYAPSC